MVRKKTIGKIQLVIGIIVLLVGIFGIVYSYGKISSAFDNLTRQDQYLKEDVERLYGDYSNETQDLIKLNYENREFSLFSFVFSFASSIASISIILIVLSLIFITQGLVNKSGNQNG